LSSNKIEDEEAPLREKKAKRVNNRARKEEEEEERKLMHILCWREHFARKAGRKKKCVCVCDFQTCCEGSCKTTRKEKGFLETHLSFILFYCYCVGFFFEQPKKKKKRKSLFQVFVHLFDLCLKEFLGLWSLQFESWSQQVVLNTERNWVDVDCWNEERKKKN
jgi:hypothetical protein